MEETLCIKFDIIISDEEHTRQSRWGMNTKITRAVMLNTSDLHDLFAGAALVALGQFDEQEKEKHND